MTPWLCVSCEREVNAAVCPECGRTKHPEVGGLRLQFSEGSTVLKWDTRRLMEGLRRAQASVRKPTGVDE
jgi:hypothetical protein